MDRIKLSEEEKAVLRLLNAGDGCPDVFPWHVFAACVDSLEGKGLAKGAWEEGHYLGDARITSRGRTYITLNPSLQNPIDWKWTITTIIAVVAVAVSIIALFVACGMK